MQGRVWGLQKRQSSEPFPFLPRSLLQSVQEALEER